MKFPKDIALEILDYIDVSCHGMPKSGDIPEYECCCLINDCNAMIRFMSFQGNYGLYSVVLRELAMLLNEQNTLSPTLITKMKKSIPIDPKCSKIQFFARSDLSETLFPYINNLSEYT